MKILHLLVLLAFASPSWAQHYRQPSQMSIDGTFTFATLPTAASYPGYTAYTSDQGPVYSNGVVWASMAGGGVPPTITANTVLGNGTALAAAPQQLAMPSCSTSSSALKWTTSTGFGCNSSINAATLGSATFAAPGSIGSGTAAAGSFTTLAASSTVSGTGFSTYLASPPAIGGSSPAAGAFTTVSATGVITSTLATGTAPFTVASTTAVTNLNASLLNGTTFAAPAAIGSGTPAAGNFTTLGSSGLFSPTLGITATGAAVSLNDSSNFNTTINTGTSTGTVTIGQNTATPSSIILKGPVSFQASTTFSGASWGTASPVWNAAATTLNDTTASGTVASAAAYSLQAVNFTSTGGASTTITSPSTLWVAAPTCSGGVVCSNLFAITTPGKVNFTNGGIINGNTLNVMVNSNNAVNIGTGTDNALVSIGGGSNAVTLNATTLTLTGGTLVTSGSPFTMSNATVKMTGITTGTNADTVCLSATGVVLIQAAACTISSLRFKEDVKDVQASTIPQISNMRVASFRMKDGGSNHDPNGASAQVGLIAENIAEVAPECAIYENDMKTPKSYRQECVIALLVKGMQTQQAEIVELRSLLRQEH